MVCMVYIEALKETHLFAVLLTLYLVHFHQCQILNVKEANDIDLSVPIFAHHYLN